MIVRPAVFADAVAMATVINQIIHIGGTTAHQTELSVATLSSYYITGPAVICCHVAETDGAVIGFQALDHNAQLPEGWADIGTFVQPGLQARGIGAALFAASVAACRMAGVVALNASIRADNVPGLAYYARRGFVDYAFDPDFTLADGRKVGRVSRRFDLKPKRLMFEIATHLALLRVCAAFVAGFVDAIAGGGWRVDLGACPAVGRGVAD